MNVSTNSAKKQNRDDANTSALSHEVFSIHTRAHTPLPSLPYQKMKDAVLGKAYHLSLVTVGATRMRTLNTTYRKKNGATDILSFPLSKTEGEIFLNPNCIRARAKKHRSTYTKHTARLFIHGMLHLKGYAHGSTMDTEEMRILKRFNLA